MIDDLTKKDEVDNDKDILDALITEEDSSAEISEILIPNSKDLSHLEKFEKNNIPLMLLFTAIPAALAFVLIGFQTILDIFFVNNFMKESKNILSAFSVYFPIESAILIGMSFGLSCGSSCLYSTSLGRRDYDSVGRIFHYTILWGLILYIIISILYFIFKDSILYLFGANTIDIEYARSYTSIMVGVGFLGYLFLLPMTIFMRTENRPYLVLIITFCVILSNCILNTIFVVFLKYSVWALAFSTSLALWTGTIISFIRYFNGNGMFKIDFRRHFFKNFVAKDFFEIISLGFGPFFMQFSFALSYLIVNNIYNKIEPLEDANIWKSSFGVSLRVVLFCNFPILGFIEAFGPIFSYNYGAKLYRRVCNTLMITLIYSYIISTVLLCILVIFMKKIANFNNTKKRAEKTFYFISILCVGIPTFYQPLVVSVIYRTEEKIFKTIFICLLKPIFLQLPLLLILEVYGADKIVFSFFISDVITSIISMFLISHRYISIWRMGSSNKSDFIKNKNIEDDLTMIDRSNSKTGIKMFNGSNCKKKIV